MYSVTKYQWCDRITANILCKMIWLKYPNTKKLITGVDHTDSNDPFFNHNYWELVEVDGLFTARDSFDRIFFGDGQHGIGTQLSQWPLIHVKLKQNQW